MDHTTDFDPSTRGFLPGADPLTSFERDDPYLQRLDGLGETLPDLVENDELRPTLRELDGPNPPLYGDLTTRELQRVYSVCAMLASAHRHKKIFGRKATEFEYDRRPSVQEAFDPQADLSEQDVNVQAGRVDEDFRDELNRRLKIRDGDWEPIGEEWKITADGDVGEEVDVSSWMLADEGETPTYRLEEVGEVLYGYDFLGLYPTTIEIPAGVAVPLYRVAKRLGVTPFLSYDAYVLYNWRLEDPDRGFEPENVEALTTFTDTEDENWFVAIHVCIENEAADAVEAADEIRSGVEDDDSGPIRAGLESIGSTFEENDVTETLGRMSERNEVEVFRIFRRFLGSFELEGDDRTSYAGLGFDEVTSEGYTPANNPDNDAGVPVFRGASGAQTALFPALDAALAVGYVDDLEYVDDEETSGTGDDRRPAGYTNAIELITDLHRYMPPAHRSFIKHLGETVARSKFSGESDQDRLGDAHDDCLEHLVGFRRRHLRTVDPYLNEDDGTGGTNWQEFLPRLITWTDRSHVGPPRTGNS